MDIENIPTIISNTQTPAGQTQLLALQKLHSLVDAFWPEVAQFTASLEALLNTANSPAKSLVCSVLSKVHYHLDDIPRAFEYASMAGSLFEFHRQSLYAKTLTEYAVDSFIQHSSGESSSAAPKASALVEKMVDERMAAGDFGSVLALAVDCQSTQLFERCLAAGLSRESSAAQNEAFLQTALSCARCAPKKLQRMLTPLAVFYGARLGLLAPISYAQLKLRSSALRGVSDLLTALTVGIEATSYVAAAETDSLRELQETLNLEVSAQQKIRSALAEDRLAPAEDINAFSEKSAEAELLALQVAFDVVESGDQRAIALVLAGFCVPYYSDEKTLALGEARVSVEEVFVEGGGDFDAKRTTEALRLAEKRSLADESPSAGELLQFSKLFYPEHFARATLIRRILSGKLDGFLNLQFLFSHCERGAPELGAILQRVANKNAVTSAALVAAHSFSRSGTAQDGFVRRNSAWFSELFNWTKFSAVASLGAIHKGNTRNSFKLLGSFLPRAGQTPSPFQESGSLFALGLIHAGNGVKTIPYLIEALSKANDNEIIQHGACLGIGVCAISLGLEEVDASLKDVLFQDNAVSGQAAALAIGFNNMGFGLEGVGKELIYYAKQTKHRKIVRGIVLGLALIGYATESHALPFVDEMLCDENEVIRYGGCFALALAFAGSEDDQALKRLLRIASTDTSSDVRRAAIMAVSFLLCRTPERVPSLLKLFAESFDPHSRYGAALAIGVSCAGSGSEAALKILDPLVTDKTDFVRNSALMASSLVLVQSGKDRKERLEVHMKRMTKVLKNKSANDFPSFAKAGAIAAIGLLKMGGGNCSIPLVTERGLLKTRAIAGVLLFLQSWYWYPFQHFLSLAISPTAFIGVNSELKIPKQHKLFCQSKAAFDFPKFDFEEKDQKKAEAKLTLSVSSKSEKERRKRRKSKEKSGEEKDVTMEDKTKALMEDDMEKSSREKAAAKQTGDESDLSGEEKWVARLEAKVGAAHLLNNPCRVTGEQKKYVGNFGDQRYCPVRRGMGIVLLRDTRPSETECLATNKFIHEMQHVDNSSK